MTLKYESEILFDLMKRDGDDAPSDVLPYESELKEKYLKQVEGAYPKLMDYRSEWLNYNLNAHLPADFPMETLSNVTRATVENVVPYTYGSASLKGQTLMNLLDRNSMTTEGLDYTFDKGVYTINTSKTWSKMIFTPRLVKNKKYFIMLSTSIPDALIFYRSSSNEATRICNAGDCPFIFTNPVDNLTTVSIEFPNIVTNGTVSHPMIIEYQEGMENWGIPYFEGMKSVQMPVLTTINGSAKILTDTYLAQTGELLPHHNSNKAIEDYILIPPMDVIVSNVSWLYICFYDENKNFISDTGGNDINKFELNDTTIPDNAKYFRFHYNSENLPLIRFVNGTDYIKATIGGEPFKSNILTTSEEVELRGIGDVKDELNLITGELTQRIGEVVLNGSEKWFGTEENYRVEIPNVKGYKDIKWGQKSAISNLYPSFEGKETDFYIISEWEGNQIRIRDVNTTLAELKTKLAKNPLHVIFLLNEESVKTVGLTVTDQYGNAESIIRPLEGTMHVSTSSQTLPPLLDMSVPVEATTQNLMSFVNIEEEEK